MTPLTGMSGFSAAAIRLRMVWRAPGGFIAAAGWSGKRIPAALSNHLPTEPCVTRPHAGRNPWRRGGSRNRPRGRNCHTNKSSWETAVGPAVARHVWWQELRPRWRQEPARAARQRARTSRASPSSVSFIWCLRGKTPSAALAFNGKSGPGIDIGSQSPRAAAASGPVCSCRKGLFRLSGTMKDSSEAKDPRQERLARALRENLKRRKAQIRGRAEKPAADTHDTPPAATSGRTE